MFFRKLISLGLSIGLLIGFVGLPQVNVQHKSLKAYYHQLKKSAPQVFEVLRRDRFSNIAYCGFKKQSNPFHSINQLGQLNHAPQIHLIVLKNNRTSLIQPTLTLWTVDQNSGDVDPALARNVPTPPPRPIA